MEVLKKKRSQLKRTITRIYNFVKCQSATYDEVKVRIIELDNIYAKYNDLQDELDILCETEIDTQTENEYRDQIEDMFFSIKAICSSQNQSNLDNTIVEGAPASTPNIINDLSTSIQAIVQQQSTTTSILECVSATLSSVTNMQSNNGQSELRLPPIQIPDFDGDLSNWIRFRDLFKAMVDSKTNLSNVEKLEYLQTKLKGEASSVIKHLPPTNENYNIAWNLIMENYNRPELIEKQYFDLLFKQKSLKNATFADFKKFYNNTVEVYNALKVLNNSIDTWNSVLLYHIEDKLDSETITLWRREKNDNETQTFPQLLKFLKKRLLELEETHQSSSSTRQRQIKAMTTTTQSCPLCSDNHFLYNCQQFKALSVHDRIKVIQTNKLCFNCLRDKHFSKDCKSSSCRTCNLKHNTLLHIDNTQTQDNQNENNASLSINSSLPTIQQTTLLPTAIIMVRDKNYALQPCRALIDSGAQSTLVSEACVQRLRLNRTHDKTLICGVGGSNANYTKGRVQLEIFASKTNRSIIVQTYCLSNLTQFLPSHTICDDNLQFFNNLHLADPEYFKKNRIDIIIGADVFPHCLLEGKVNHPSGSPIALNTVFGWIVMGNVNEIQQSTFIAHIYSDLDMQLQKFWDIEDCQHATKHLTEEEEMAENHYSKNVQRQKDGKYMVRLPFKSNPVELGESKSSALKRLESMERKFAKNQELKVEFHKFMEEYENLNHMQVAPDGEKQAYYMPHHAVLKPSSTTTKLRVVFDASCKTANKLSLNDHLLVGPTVQNDLYSIMLNFRKFEIGFTADIEKMYRQVIIHPADRPFQTILWRNSPEEAAIEYNLTTVTYGTAAAPFLATRTLQQVATDNSKEYPTESDEIMNSFYVDDYMSSSPDLETANSLRATLCSILLSAGFNLRKWSSNSQQFRDNIQFVDRAVSPDTIIDCSETVKTLGLLWNTATDCFQYSVVLMESPRIITKRHVLSEISKIYDPIGWLAPTVIRLKIFMQKLWLKGINWDQELPNDLKNEYLLLKQNIHHIKDLQISRWLQLCSGEQIELHGFSDSSELAYAAAVYIRVLKQDGSTSTSLLTAKTRVAPIKQISLPRLELCAAHLLVKLMIKVKHALKLKNVTIHGWSDSTVVLAWLSDHPRRWKTFIANRTSYIIDNLPAKNWHHIASKLNPADLATRGISSTDLINNNLWWKGPHSLLDHFEQPQSTPTQISEEVLREERKTIIATTTSRVIDNIDLIERYSSFTKLLRITAYLLRFTHNCRSKANNSEKKYGFITTTELEKARISLIKYSQRQSFDSEILIIASERTLSTTHKLAALIPFLDDNGILRVGGRLQNANINYDQKHPCILDRKDKITQLIVEHYHKKYLHAGTRQLQYLLGLKYWIPNITYLLKRTVYKCSTCMRFRQLPHRQRMGELPSYRVQPGSTFFHVGIDFAGPILLRSWKGRGSRSYKCWIAVFVCLNTKAIHLEAVTELTTAAFLAALRRFTSRRGKAGHIYTDNGTNFIGCNQKLKELFEFLQNSQDVIIRELSNQQINWHFIPPSAPNFGGVWEAGVKSMKFHLNRVLGISSVTYEELTTLLCQIESCLNSRPLCLKYEGDPDPLTPGHFLILRPMASLPDEKLIDVKVNRLTRWQYMQQLLQQFWSKWSKEYLGQLQKRPKWLQKLKNLQQNDMVLIKDENLPPTKWLIGRIMETHPGNDGLVRVATVKTTNGLLKRSVSKLCPLFVEC